MIPIGLISSKWKILGGVLMVLAILAAAAGAGATINGWRIDAAHQHEIAAKRDEYAALLAQYNDLRLKVEQQNGSIMLLGYKTEVAGERREQAERWAASAVQSGERRIADIKASAATSCEGVLREAWGK